MCLYFSTKKSTNICRKSFADKLGSILDKTQDDFVEKLRQQVEFHKEMNRFARKHRPRIMKFSRKSCNPWPLPLTAKSRYVLLPGLFLLLRATKVEIENFF